MEIQLSLFWRRLYSTASDSCVTTSVSSLGRTSSKKMVAISFWWFDAVNVNKVSPYFIAIRRQHIRQVLVIRWLYRVSDTKALDLPRRGARIKPAFTIRVGGPTYSGIFYNYHWRCTQIFYDE